MAQFHPDSSLVADIVPSPNHDERRNDANPNMILLHYTGMPDSAAALRRLCSPSSEVSSHYVVFEDGRIVQCVAEARRAWHAGVSFWAGETDINSCSIGIEIANPGHGNGYPDFPRRQIAAVITLCRGIAARRHIRADRVLAHSDVAPARKKDPGERFPWRLLHESGVGHWVEPAPLGDGGGVTSPGGQTDAVKELQSALAKYGYEVTASGNLDSQTQDAVTAFQRHFRPARVDGVADVSTRETLRKLIDARKAFLASARAASIESALLTASNQPGSKPFPPART
jgi:N-acetylmuramoyl-L-alanine amidase